MATITSFDHWSDQEHESVPAFLSAWSPRPWDDMNVPVGLKIGCADEDCGWGDNEDVPCGHWPREADFLVLLPRKEHVKHVRVGIQNGAELARLRQTLVGVGEGLYAAAATRLERFGRGEPFPNTLILYYWDALEEAEATP